LFLLRSGEERVECSPVRCILQQSIRHAQVKVGLTSILTTTLIKILITNKVIMCRQYVLHRLSLMYHSSIYNIYMNLN
jgi:hypothetical protein